MLEKIGEAEINGLLVKSAAAIRELSAENLSLKSQLASRGRQDHAEKIAHVMVERGLMDDSAGKEYAQTLAKGDKDLSVVEDLVQHSVPGLALGHTKTASAHDEDSTPGEDVLTSFLKSTPLS